MEAGYYVTRTWESGPVGEKVKFWVPGDRPTRSARKLKAEAKKRLDNELNAERRVARLCNANFSNGDVFVTLDYSEEGLAKVEGRIKRTDGLEELELLNERYMAAEHELRLLLRRVRRACERAGVALRYLAITADVDGDTGEAVRVHHHLLANREAAEAIRSKWTLGGVRIDPLKRQKDYTPVATYLMRQVRRIGKEKNYIPSRSLKQPKVQDRVVMSGAELRPPKGAELLYRGVFIPGRPQYIRYFVDSTRPHGGGRQIKKQ